MRSDDVDQQIRKLTMPGAIQVLIASRSDKGITAIQSAIASVSGINSESLLMRNGNTDPLQGATDPPSVLILHSCATIAEELDALTQHPQQDLPILLMFGEDLASDAVRLALRAGARDIVSDTEPAALARALSELVFELSADDDSQDSHVIVVMNAKGGSGGTFIASNLAHMAAAHGSGDALIVDLDFQYASLPHYFDLAPERSLLDALTHAHHLDHVAIEAYTAVHDSGLRIMAPLPDNQTGIDFDITERVRALLPTLRMRYRNVVFDVPRHIDEVSTPILKDADHVLMVLQQSLPSVRDAVRLKTTLLHDMHVDESRVHAVINRHVKTGTIELEDIKEALGEEHLLLVPNHYKAVGQSIDMGIPILEYAPNSPVIKALSKICAKFMGEPNSFLVETDSKGSNAIERLKQWSPF